MTTRWENTLPPRTLPVPEPVQTRPAVDLRALQAIRRKLLAWALPKP